MKKQQNQNRVKATERNSDHLYTTTYTCKTLSSTWTSTRSLLRSREREEKCCIRRLEHMLIALVAEKSAVDVHVLVSNGGISIALGTLHEPMRHAAPRSFVASVCARHELSGEIGIYMPTYKHTHVAQCLHIFRQKEARERAIAAHAPNILSMCA